MLVVVLLFERDIILRPDGGKNAVDRVEKRKEIIQPCTALTRLRSEPMCGKRSLSAGRSHNTRTADGPGRRVIAPWTVHDRSE